MAEGPVRPSAMHAKSEEEEEGLLIFPPQKKMPREKNSVERADERTSLAEQYIAPGAATHTPDAARSSSFSSRGEHPSIQPLRPRTSTTTKALLFAFVCKRQPCALMPKKNFYFGNFSHEAESSLERGRRGIFKYLGHMSNLDGRCRVRRRRLKLKGTEEKHQGNQRRKRQSARRGL